MVYEEQSPISPDVSPIPSSRISGRSPISEQDATKLQKSVADFGRSMQHMGNTIKYGDPGKAYLHGLLDDLSRSLQDCINLADQIKTYPLDKELPNLDPINTCRRGLEDDLLKLRRRLQILQIDEQIMTAKKNVQAAEERRERLMKGGLL